MSPYLTPCSYHVRFPLTKTVFRGSWITEELVSLTGVRGFLSRTTPSSLVAFVGVPIVHEKALAVVLAVQSTAPSLDSLARHGSYV